jgi:AraC-like DNA-binding protein
MDERLLQLPDVASVRSIAYEPIYALADHTPEHSELIHVIDGRLRLSMGGRRYAAGPGDTLLAPCDLPHRDIFDLSEGLDVLLVHFRWPGEEPFRQSVGNNDLLALSSATRAEASRVFDAMRCDYGGEALDRTVAAARIHCLLLLFYRDVERRRRPETAPVSPGETSHRRLVVEAKAYMEVHYAEPITLDQVAAALSVSPFHLSRVFGQESDFSLFGYLANVRLTKARQLLLEQSVPVAEVAYAVGYASPNYFAKVFRKAFGFPPSQARRR